jgi:Beta/Gamma crystallin
MITIHGPLRENTMAEQPHLILYIDDNFRGLQLNVFQSISDLNEVKLFGAPLDLEHPELKGTWNDKVSSMVILHGRWQFFADNNFGPSPLTPNGLGPGLYPNVAAHGIPHDVMSSVKLMT